jgi:dihydrofolate reductase
MPKIMVFNMVSVDGFFAGTDGSINWHNVDGEFNEFAAKQTGEFGMLIFGRVTYDLMANYWPTDQARKNDPIVAKIMNTTPKIVFSKNLQKATWNNTSLVSDINVDEIKQLKEQSKKDMAIFGSGQIVREFAKLGFIDEYRLMVNPVILGTGKPLFKELMKLKLLKSREFKNGNVLLTYQPVL